MRIVVNAGHYPGKDSGACGTILQEANVTKDVMGIVAGYLRYSGHEVLEVQENELWEITNASNDFNADIFVSIHCNAAENRDAEGTEVFFASNNGAKLAKCIQDQIVNTMNTIDRGVKPCNFYVVRNTDAVAVLVELAFISNANDEELLRGTEGFAGAVYRGIIEYL